MMVVVLGVCFCAGTLLANDKAKDDLAKPVKGKVEVVKNGDAITSITIVGKDKKVEVVLDEKGKGLAALDGKYVTVRGADADGKITVTDFKEKTERNKAAAKDDKKDAAATK